MAFQAAKDAEPILGYRLLEKLGTGGYGEVWKVTAPGGLTKAVKIVYGDMSGARAGQELKALERIKQVRHPFLLSLERFEILDDQLFIVTELADCCLMDRYQDCRKAGMKGIPRDELIGYIRDAAEALDYMAETHGLQHLDIKPQNLLIVSGRIKVADFGLVKELIGTSVTATGGVTPIYATPEAFDGRVSRFSDQYSLGIVYQEMLTGIRPFPGITMMQLAAQHMSSPPLLQPLPPGDRPAIARALAKLPESRFASCQRMVEALMTGRLTSTTNPIVTPEQIARAKMSGLVPKVVLPAQTPPIPGIPTTPVAPSGALPPRTVATPCNLVVLPGQQAPADSPSPRTVADYNSPPPLRQTPPPFQLGQTGNQRPSREVLDAVAPSGKTGLRPTLFLGIGGLACATLRHLRGRLHKHFGGLGNVPIFHLLLVDTDREEMRLSRQGDPREALESDETLLAPLHLPDYYRDESKKLLRWLDRRWLYGIPRSLLTEGLRPLGRLALVDNAPTLLSHLREILAKITRPDIIDDTVAATGLTLRDEAPRVFVVSSIAGGTGSGMLVGMAYAVRQVLGELGLPARGLCGLLLHATSPKPADRQMARINASATLHELYHFSQPNSSYPGDPENGLERFTPGLAPFEDCYLVHLGDGLDKSRVVGATRNLADYLFLDASPEGGAVLDRFRHETKMVSPVPGMDGQLRAIGLARIGADGPGSAAHDALFCARRLTELWSGEDAGGKDKKIELEAEREVTSLGLEEEDLIGRFRDAVVKQIGESPESYFTKMNAWEEGAPSQGETFQEALEKIDQLLGPCADPNENENGWTPLTAAVHQHAGDYGAKLGDALVDWLLDLIETPGKRFNAAGRATARIGRHLHALNASLRKQLNLARNQGHALRQLLLTGKVGSKGSGIRLLGLNRAREEGTSPSRKLLEYGKLRILELALSNAMNVLSIVQGPLSRFIQELVLARQKLVRFAGQFPDNTAEAEAHSRPREGDEEPDSILPRVLRRFDETIQKELLNPQGGLWAMFSGAHAIRRSTRRHSGGTPEGDVASPPVISAEALKEELLSRSRAFLREVLPDRNATQSFLDAYIDADEARPALLRYLEEATPQLRVDGGREHLLLGVPDCPAKDAILELVVEAIPDMPLTPVGSDEDVFLVFEGAGYPIVEMAAALAGSEPPDPELVRRVVTRIDVPWSFCSSAPAQTS